jgi:hypothetical protein
MLNCGTHDSHMGCINLQLIKSSATPSLIKNCAIHHGHGYGLWVKNSAYFTVEDCVFHSFIERGLMVSFSNHFTITKNVISYIDKR